MAGVLHKVKYCVCKSNSRKKPFLVLDVNPGCFLKFRVLKQEMSPLYTHSHLASLTLLKNSPREKRMKMLFWCMLTPCIVMLRCASVSPLYFQKYTGQCEDVQWEVATRLWGKIHTWFMKVKPEWTTSLYDSKNPKYDGEGYINQDVY